MPDNFYVTTEVRFYWCKSQRNLASALELAKHTVKMLHSVSFARICVFFVFNVIDKQINLTIESNVDNLKHMFITIVRKWGGVFLTL